jgi:cytosine deaminase
MNDWIEPGRPKDFVSPVELGDEVERRRKAFTSEDIQSRAGYAIQLASRHGITAMRAQCHLDPTVKFKHLDALVAVKEKYRHLLDLQIVTFPQQGLLKTPGTLDLFREAFRRGADVMGCAPNLDMDANEPFGFRKHIDAAFNLAMECDVPLDLHADIFLLDDPSLDDLEAVYAAKKALELGYQGKVAAGHVCALDSARPEVAQEAIEWMRQAQVHVISQPDLYRLGRADQRNVRRGLTRVKALLAAGVNVTYASNNVRDAYRPLGNLNPIEEGLVLSYGAHMDSRKDLATLLRMSTYHGAKALDLQNYGLQPGNRADVVVLDAFSAPAVIANQAEKLFVFKNGKLVAENPPGNARYYNRTVETLGMHSPWQGDALVQKKSEK